MSKSLEIVNEALEFQIVSTVKLLGNIDKKIFKLSLTDLDTIKQDLERLEEINKVWNDNEPMESVDINGKHLQELYDYINKLEKENEQLKQQRDSLAINNGELCVKVCKLEKENQELKEKLNGIPPEYDGYLYFAQGISNVLKENEKLKKAIEILKDFFDFDIYAGEGKGYIDCCVENPTFDLYNDTQFKEYELLKEVLK